MANQAELLPIEHTLRFFMIVAGSVLLACVLGVALDMVIANVAAEYFTEHHPNVTDSEEPVHLALVWGVLASWWAGLAGGLIIATVHWLVRSHLTPWRVLALEAKACVLVFVGLLVILGLGYVSARKQPWQDEGEFLWLRRFESLQRTHQFQYVLVGVAIVGVCVRLGQQSQRGQSETIRDSKLAETE